MDRLGRGRPTIAHLLLFPVLFLLGGCGDGGDDAPRALYRVTVTNVTAAQPLSPVAVILHDDRQPGWQVGSAASVGLEVLAEGGDPSELVAEASGGPGGLAAAAGDAAIPPGSAGTLDVEAEARASTLLSLATMLVNTNDGFTGVSALPVGSLARAESEIVALVPYDAGT